MQSLSFHDAFVSTGGRETTSEAIMISLMRVSHIIKKG